MIKNVLDDLPDMGRGVKSLCILRTVRHAVRGVRGWASAFVYFHDAFPPKNPVDRVSGFLLSHRT